MKATSFRNHRASAILALIFCISETNAQSSKDFSASKKDTVSMFNSRLKITLTDGAFERMQADVTASKYKELFNLHDVIKSRGFVLRAKDTLVFYMTTVDRPVLNDGGISTWEIINSFLDKTPAYRLESGWNKLGRDYIYFVKLILNKKADQLFEFNFFFIDNKLAFSLLQRPIKEPNIFDQASYTVISPN